MTVGGLIDALALFDRDTEVVIEDADTNMYLKLTSIHAERYEKNALVVLSGDYPDVFSI